MIAKQNNRSVDFSKIIQAELDTKISIIKSKLEKGTSTPAFLVGRRGNVMEALISAVEDDKFIANFELGQCSIIPFNSIAKIYL